MSRILNLGHRGDPKGFPENTLLSFQKCMEAGAQGIECDVRITQDGHLVVFHDGDLKRVCGVAGSVETMNLVDLQKLKVLGSEEGIPTVKEVIQSFPNAVIDFEIKKTARHMEVLDSLEEMLRAHPVSQRLMFSTFCVSVLYELRRRQGEIFGEIGLIFDEQVWSVMKWKIFNLPCDFLVLPPQILRDWRRIFLRLTGLPLMIWSINTEDEWKRAEGIGFVAIISDEPARLKTYLDAYLKGSGTRY